jgi:hypothetical protein
MFAKTMSAPQHMKRKEQRQPGHHVGSAASGNPMALIYAVAQLEELLLNLRRKEQGRNQRRK